MTNRDGFRFKADPIRHHARARGDNVAVIFEGRETTYKELNRRSNQVANGLAAAGIQRGQRIAILAKNTDLFYELLYGATKIGAVLAPINFRLAPPEVSYVINDAQAQLLFVGAGYEDLIAGIGDELSGVREIISLHDGSYQAWRDGQSEVDPRAETSEHDTIIQVYSSGTTGHPKGVEISHDNFIQYLPNAMDEWGAWDDGDVCLVTNPLFHVAGCTWSYTAFYVGGSNVLMPEVDPAAILKTIETYRVTQALLVPAVILFMLQTPGVETADLSSMKMIMYGASPIPYPVLERAVELFGCGFGHLYGLTETTGAVTYLPPEDHDGSDKMKSVGKVMLGAEIRVVDENDRDCAADAVGEIIVRGKTITKGYWNLAGETAKAIRDGWLYTGDAGYFDGDGYLYIYDRVKDMIVSGAENVYPAEVESALAGHHKIADVGVIGIPDEKWGETVKAIIVVKPGETLTAAEVMTFARTRIAGYKIPRSVDFVDELPRNPSGKILKRELRRPYWEGYDRQVN